MRSGRSSFKSANSRHNAPGNSRSGPKELWKRASRRKCAFDGNVSHAGTRVARASFRSSLAMASEAGSSVRRRRRRSHLRVPGYYPVPSTACAFPVVCSMRFHTSLFTGLQLVGELTNSNIARIRTPPMSEWYVVRRGS